MRGFLLLRILEYSRAQHGHIVVGLVPRSVKRARQNFVCERLRIKRFELLQKFVKVGGGGEGGSYPVAHKNYHISAL